MQVSILLHSKLSSWQNPHITTHITKLASSPRFFLKVPFYSWTFKPLSEPQHLRGLLTDSSVSVPLVSFAYKSKYLDTQWEGSAGEILCCNTADLSTQKWLLIRSVSQSLLENEQFSQQGCPGVDYTVVSEKQSHPVIQGWFSVMLWSHVEGRGHRKLKGKSNKSIYKKSFKKNHLLRDLLCVALTQDTGLHAFLGLF